jgi:hypothetical protein
VPTTVRPRVLAAAGLAVLLAACATVPDSGSVQRGKVAAAGAQYFLQPVIQGPQPNWSPTQVVSGFLEATSSFAHGYAAARQYLTSRAQGFWETQPGWAASVVSQLAVTQMDVSPRIQGSTSPGTDAYVNVSGQEVATVSDEGQYLSNPGTYGWAFQLQKINGEWRIANPPPQPPVYAPDFQRVYLPRNLFFLAPSGIVPVSQALVPAPIFVPLQATSVDVADTLVSALLHNPAGWLTGAAVTALAGAKLLGKVTVNAGTAVVDLGGIAASGPLLGRILAQLVWTLASPSYGQPGIAQSVELEIDGHPQPLASWSGGQPQQGGNPLLTVTQIPPAQPIYSLIGRDVVGELSLSAGSTLRVPVHVGDGRDPLTSIAVSPNGRYVAGITRSGAVYYGLLQPGSRLTEQATGGPFTSVSWDSNGNLWMVGTSSVWMLHPGQSAVQLSGLPSGPIVQMQVAPDGVRAALIVHYPSGNQLQLCAIAYTGGPSLFTGATLDPPLIIGVNISNPISDPTQLTWYDADNLIVLSPSSTGSLLYQVPVNGGSSTELISTPGTLSISAAGPANPLVAGLPRGAAALAGSLNATWAARSNVGSSPTYAAPAPASP